MGRGTTAARLARLARDFASQQQKLAEATRSVATSAGVAAPTKISGEQAATNFQQTRSKSLAAQAVQTQTSSKLLPDIALDAFGAVSVVSETSKVQPGVYKNQDGHRFDDGRYQAFIEEISAFVGKERQFTDPVRTFAYGTDASFYRLNPKLVVKVSNETEIQRILPIAKKHGVPVTFRAAGTSLSGQAITDSVLLKISHNGKNFRNYKVHVRRRAPAHRWRSSTCGSFAPALAAR